MQAIPLRFAFYGRVSTKDKQQPHLSFPSQRRECEHRIKDLGSIVADFQDNDSGMKEALPGITELLEEAARPDRRFDAVVTYDITRLSRSTLLSMTYEKALKDLGIFIYASTESGNPADLSSLTVRRVLQLKGDLDILETTSRTIRGLKENMRQGYHNGGPAPYGYRINEVSHPDAAVAARGEKKHILERARLLRSFFAG